MNIGAFKLYFSTLHSKKKIFTTCSQVFEVQSTDSIMSSLCTFSLNISHIPLKYLICLIFPPPPPTFSRVPLKYYLSAIFL